MPRLALVLAALVASACAAPTAASAAAIRYASPTGSGTACSAAAPCDLVTAVNSASAGDEVVVAGNQGTYGTAASPITTQLTDNGGVILHGAAGQPMPVIYMKTANKPGINWLNFGTVSDLDVEQLDSTGYGVLMTRTADHLIVHSAYAGCEPFPDATVVDSLCAGARQGVFSNVGTSGSHTLTLRNVTAVAGTGGVGFHYVTSAYTQNINATNVIARGGFKDINVSSGSGTVTMKLDHSNYSAVLASAPDSVTPAGTGTNQAAAPLFANAGAGDYYEAPGSPTIDMGADSAANGTTDFEGEPRLFGAHTDIGADELRYRAPSVVSESVSSVTPRSAVVVARINTGGAPATAHFDFGRTTAYGGHIQLTPTLSPSPQTLTATISGTASGTTYHFRVVVTNGAGTAAGADQTFPTPPTKASLFGLAATRTVFAVAHAPTPRTGVTSARHKRGTTFSFRLDQAATVTIAIQRRVPGRRVHGKCRAGARHARGHRCRRTVTIFTLTRIGHPGLNAVAFTGRVGHKRLKPGRYVAVFVPTTAAGKSPPSTISFRIAKR